MSVVKVSLTLCTVHWVTRATGQARGHSSPRKQGASSLLGHANDTGPGGSEKSRRTYQRDILKTTVLEPSETVGVHKRAQLRLKILLASSVIARHTKNLHLSNVTLADT